MGVKFQEVSSNRFSLLGVSPPSYGTGRRFNPYRARHERSCDIESHNAEGPWRIRQLDATTRGPDASMRDKEPLCPTLVFSSAVRPGRR
jgi:hypothetical protein